MIKDISVRLIFTPRRPAENLARPNSWTGQRGKHKHLICLGNNRSPSYVSWIAAASFTVAFHPAVAEKAPSKIHIPSVILAEPDTHTPLAIQLQPGSKLPTQSFVKIKGLPDKVQLSAGHSVSAGVWAIPIKSLPTLRITAPMSSVGNAELNISLVSIEGEVIAEQTAKLIVAPAWLLTPAMTPSNTTNPDRVAQPAVPVVPQNANAQVNSEHTSQQTHSKTASLSLAPADTTAGITHNGAISEQPNKATAKPLSPSNIATAQKLVDQGRHYIEHSNIAIARQFFTRAANLGYAPAALELARTYDPIALADSSMQGVTPDQKLAEQWYTRARELGSSDAGDALTRLEKQ